ncbi:PKD domain-containing protein [Candidatus Bipolaricaulota bacterium]|nr:PKD domain-containing protein [Candidatus Bipolaricaulota bacterium]
MRKSKLTFLALLIFSLTLFLSGCGPTNQEPSASFSANPTSGNASLEVTCDASNSSDPDGSIISYDWDFDDGSNGSGEIATHTYDSAGNYTAELTVTDNDGATDSTTQSIDVSPPPSDPPTASFTSSPTSGEAPLEISFDASGSSDPDGTIDSYSWDFDDGSTGSGKTTSYTFDNSGNYTVELTVVDNDGNSDSTHTTISVSSSPSVDYWVTAKEITEEVDENSVAAKTKYEGTTIGVTGEISDINLFLGITVVLDGIDLSSVQCQFPESREDQVADLSKGEQVTIIGDFDSITLGDVFIENSYVD